MRFSCIVLTSWCLLAGAVFAATPTQYYVRPTNGTDSAGNGTSHGTAYLTIQYALNDIGTTHGQDTTDGDQINICDESTASPSGSLSLATYGTPGEDYPLIFRGYTSAANDGGIGVIDMTNVALFAATNNFMHLIDLHITDGGSADLVTLGSRCSVVNCEVDDTTGDGITPGQYNLVANCNIHNIGGKAIDASLTSSVTVANCYVSGTPTTAIHLGTACTATRNIVTISGSSNGILCGNHGSVAMHNSVLSASGSGTPYGIARGSNAVNVSIWNNVVEGFTTGTGIDDQGSGNRHWAMCRGNAVYNCSTEYDLGDVVYTDDNETVTTASPFAKSGSDTFATRFTYFELDPSTSSIEEGTAFPDGNRLDKGAVQHEDPAGGGGGTISSGWFK
jgi:hypothetical protein